MNVIVTMDKNIGQKGEMKMSYNEKRNRQMQQHKQINKHTP